MIAETTPRRGKVPLPALECFINSEVLKFTINTNFESVPYYIIQIGLTHFILKSPYPPDKGGYGGLGDLGGLKDRNFHFLPLNAQYLPNLRKS